MKLDDFTGVLSLEHLDVNTMVYLYSEQGELIGKIHSTKSSATFTLPQKGMYVLVIHCLSYPVEVKKKKSRYTITHTGKSLLFITF